MVKEFYANLEDRDNDQVLVREKWTNMLSEATKKHFGAHDHEEGDYSVLMDEGIETIELVKKFHE